MAPSLTLRARGGVELAGEAAELDAFFEQRSHWTLAVGAQLCHPDALVARPDAFLALDGMCVCRRAMLTHGCKRYAAGARERVGHLDEVRPARGRYPPQRTDQPDVPNGVRERRPHSHQAPSGSSGPRRSAELLRTRCTAGPRRRRAGCRSPPVRLFAEAAWLVAAVFGRAVPRAGEALIASSMLSL